MIMKSRSHPHICLLTNFTLKRLSLKMKLFCPHVLVFIRLEYNPLFGKTSPDTPGLIDKSVIENTTFK